MTIRQQIDEAARVFNSCRRHYLRELDDYVARVCAIREKCPHPVVRSDVSQAGVEYRCTDCGQEFDEPPH